MYLQKDTQFLLNNEITYTIPVYLQLLICISHIMKPACITKIIHYV